MREFIAIVVLGSILNNGGVGQIRSISSLLSNVFSASSGPVVITAQSGLYLYGYDRYGRAVTMINYERGDDLMPHDINR